MKQQIYRTEMRVGVLNYARRKPRRYHGTQAAMTVATTKRKQHQQQHYQQPTQAGQTDSSNLIASFGSKPSARTAATSTAHLLMERGTEVSSSSGVHPARECMPSSSNALKAMEAAPSRNAFVDLRTVTHSAVHVDLRTVAQSMGKRYQQELESALVSAGIEDAQANTPQTLHVDAIDWLCTDAIDAVPVEEKLFWYAASAVLQTSNAGQPVCRACNG